MDNPTTTNNNQDQQIGLSQQRDHGQQPHHVDTQADIASAKLAWEAWKSNDPKRVDQAIDERTRLLREDPKAWRKAMREIDEQADVASAKSAWADWKSNDPTRVDHALAEKHRLLKEDPKAWKKAMNEIDADERRAIAEAQLQKELQAEQAATAQSGAPQSDVASPAQPVQPTEVVLPTITLARPADMAAGAVTQPYSPDGTVVATQSYPADGFAPPPPDTPAYNAAYNQAPARFYGLDLGIVKLGVNSHGSLDGGFNLGFLKGEGQVGLENRGDVEIFPGVKSLHARAGAGIGVNRDGFHGEAGAGANVFNLVGGDLDVGARLGNNTGVDGDFRGKAVVAEGQGSAGLSLDQNGLGVHGGGNGNLLQTVGARGGGRFNLGPDHTGGAAGVGLDFAGKTLDIGPSVDAYSDGTVAQGFHLDPGQKWQPTFFPTGDRQLDQP